MKNGIAHLLLLLFTLPAIMAVRAQADPQTYLGELKAALGKKWPANRTINLVFHGHSVPSGYFQTPAVHTLEAYPHQVLQQLKELYPYAVINVITTSIGGENSVQGRKRLKKDVLPHCPDVLFIDYALNDRAIGLEASRIAMEKMIRQALKKKIKVILMTASPDLAVDLLKQDNILNQFSQQLIRLAAKYRIGLADSYAAFYEQARSGKDVRDYMAQSNHPNEKGHRLIADRIMQWFQTK
ncbi:SGNH/GDSL hydrolase family protein [Niabella drilacis]|uniref:Lysophospholipase L1 n=1 Tax=Niabella drilacis (strain DSM 25811 / CCM 8410 / CCUG 62505 / LMG 26954 / E90) TaxID=1285928 RepID=A0A1G6L343_NIADE|nr:GDSL-type esterase/lipase family protein [Niabella drilacis]SDC37531.1 Lysophospholipase L1 [Niabella drilacis]